MFNFYFKHKKFSYKIKKSKKNSNKTKKSTKKNSKLNSGKSKKELCAHKYKDKSIRGTPKNWAYNRCMKDGWER
jgi:hypothetical protein